MKKEIIAYVCDDKAEATERITNTIMAFLKEKENVGSKHFLQARSLPKDGKSFLPTWFFSTLICPG